jgi:hypothetical protein
MAAEAPELIVQVPGDPTAAPTDGAAPAADDASAARIAELEAAVAQQAALISQLNAQAAYVATVPNAAPPTPGVRRTIGVDYSSKTSAEAREDGVSTTVLCSDGYYVPGA